MCWVGQRARSTWFGREKLHHVEQQLLWQLEAKGGRRQSDGGRAGDAVAAARTVLAALEALIRREELLLAGALAAAQAVMPPRLRVHRDGTVDDLVLVERVLHKCRALRAVVESVRRAVVRRRIVFKLIPVAHPPLNAERGRPQVQIMHLSFQVSQ
jgi:hypothetical protein